MSYQGRSPSVNRLRLSPRSSDPVNPLEGDLQYADGSARAEGLWTYKDGAWTSVGSANGAKNYVLNGNFEGSGTTGFSIANSTIDSTTKVPNQASGSWTAAAGTLSIAQITSGQLAGRASIRYVSSAATTVGDMLVTDAFTIDKEDQAKPLTVKFYYEAFSGSSNANFSGTSSNSFSVQIYDVTNSVWIQPAGTFGLTQGSGVGYCTATFQTSITGTQYRLAISNANATAGAITMYFDDFFVGPQTAPIGAVITDWQSYTPTFAGFGTASAVRTQWRRVGDSVQIRGAFTIGTPTAVTATMSLPPGLAIASSITSNQIVGKANSSAYSTTNFSGMTLQGNGGNSHFTFGGEYSAGGGQDVILGNTLLPASSTIMIQLAVVPIAGWSSNVQVSDDTDSRVVSFYGTQSSEALTANVTNLTLTATKDTHGSWSTNLYTVPVSGDYAINGTLIASGGFAPVVYKNGTAVQTWTTVSSSEASSGSTLLPGLVAGDTISIRSTTSVTITNSSMGIFRLSGPSVIASTESVNMGYGCAVAPTIPNAVQTLVAFPTKEFDSHNAYNTTTGLYTCPVSGVYEISGSLYYGATIAAVSDVQLTVYRSGVLVRGVNSPKSGTSSTPIAVSGTFLLRCNAGQTLALYAYQSSGSSLALIANDDYNWISIKRVGN